jgi:DNA-directed RNA polymerase subunit L
MNELLCLIEITIIKSSLDLTITAKSEDHDFGNAIVDYISRVFV